MGGFWGKHGTTNKYLDRVGDIREAWFNRTAEPQPWRRRDRPAEQRTWLLGPQPLPHQLHGGRRRWIRWPGRQCTQRHAGYHRARWASTIRWRHLPSGTPAGSCCHRWEHPSNFGGTGGKCKRWFHDGSLVLLDVHTYRYCVTVAVLWVRVVVGQRSSNLGHRRVCPVGSRISNGDGTGGSDERGKNGKLWNQIEYSRRLF